MRAALMMLVACGGGEAIETPDAGPGFTYKANAFQREGVTSVTVDGVASGFVPGIDGFPTFFLEEHFESYAAGLASPSRHVIFYAGDEIGIEGDLGPGACTHSPCGSALTEEDVEIRWIDHFTRFDWDENLSCRSLDGVCGQIDG